MPKDLCGCGNLKDSRSLKCRSCNYGYNETTKTCVKCLTKKPVDDFRIRTRKIPRPRSTCRECEAANQRYRNANATEEQKQRREYHRRKWEQDNPEKQKIILRKRKIRSLGLVENEEYILHLLEVQQTCSICDCNSPSSQELSIDHCHETGRFRGLLCQNCNHGLGHFKDNVEYLKRAISYLCK